MDAKMMIFPRRGFLFLPLKPLLKACLLGLEEVLARIGGGRSKAEKIHKSLIKITGLLIFLLYRQDDPDVGKVAPHLDKLSESKDERAVASTDANLVEPQIGHGLIGSSLFTFNNANKVFVAKRSNNARDPGLNWWESTEFPAICLV